MTLIRFTLFLFLTSIAFANSYTFAPIASPEGLFISTSFSLLGITDDGTVAGCYFQPGGSCILLNRNGVESVVAVPGAVTTEIDAINHMGEAVGIWSADGITFQGFTRDPKGTYNTFALPTQRPTPIAIDNRGEILILTDNTLTNYSYVLLDLKGNKSGQFSAPGDLAAFNNAHQAVGCLSVSALCRALSGSLDSGQYGVLAVPGLPGSDAHDINDRGQVVGTEYGFPDVLSHGYFLDSTGEVTQIDYPGAIETFASFINDKGEIAGTFDDGSGEHFYYATPTPEPASGMLFALASVCLSGKFWQQVRKRSEQS